MIPVSTVHTRGPTEIHEHITTVSRDGEWRLTPSSKQQSKHKHDVTNIDSIINSDVKNHTADFILINKNCEKITLDSSASSQKEQLDKSHVRTKMQTNPSICPYCGCGCRLNFVIDNDKIIKVLPDKSDEVSEGKPCIKGLTLHEVLQNGRILKPMIRKTKESELQKVSWKEAYEFIHQKIKDIPPEEIFFNLSGKITNEDNFIIQKFAGEILKTRNIDSCCSRLCHKATVEALQRAFGTDSNPWKMNDVYNIDCLLIIGSNPASNYPVLFNKILKSKSKGMKLISVQPIKNLTSKYADAFFSVSPFSESIFLSGIIRFLIKSKSYDKDIEKMKEFSELCRIVEDYSPKTVAKLCKIDEKKFVESLLLIKNSNSFAIIHGMGITQDVNATENVHSILNLLILKNGKLLSCRGEANVQGSSDMSYLNSRESSGKNIIEMFLISPAKVAFISGFNPAQSLPNLNEVHKNMKEMFIIQLEPHENLTSEFADVILPTPVLVERTGTITSGERRIRLVKKIMEPLGESKPEWKFFQELSKIFGQKKEFTYEDEKQISQEIKNNIPDYNKINVEKIYSGEDSWADKKIKFKKLNPQKIKVVEDKRDEEHQFILTTFRSQYHFLTGELTSKSKTLQKFSDGAYCYINKIDAKKLNLKNEDSIKVSSKVSSIIAEVKIDESVPERVVGMCFHFEKLLVNKLFPTEYDKETFTPNYKSVAVKIEKIK